MYAKIKFKYDGYHFAGGAEAVFNPFSLLNALGDRLLRNYWFASGTPTFLIKQMQHFHTDITSLDSLDVPESAFDQPTENMKDEGCAAAALPERLPHHQGLRPRHRGL